MKRIMLTMAFGIAVFATVGGLPAMASAQTTTQPTATVTPSAGLVDDQEVQVAASGFVTSAAVYASQCTSIDGKDVCNFEPMDDGVDGYRWVAGALTDGAANLALIVDKTFQGTHNGPNPGDDIDTPVDCTVSQCYVFLEGADQTGHVTGERARRNIGFGTPPAPPTPLQQLKCGVLVAQRQAIIRRGEIRIATARTARARASAIATVERQLASNTKAMAKSGCPAPAPWTPPGPAASVTAQGVPETTYTVQSGDTLSGIAAKTLGDATRYHELAGLNGIANPSVIYPGQVLRLA